MRPQAMTMLLAMSALAIGCSAAPATPPLSTPTVAVAARQARCDTAALVTRMTRDYELLRDARRALAEEYVRDRAFRLRSHGERLQSIAFLEQQLSDLGVYDDDFGARLRDARQLLELAFSQLASGQIGVEEFLVLEERFETLVRPVVAALSVRVGICD